MTWHVLVWLLKVMNTYIHPHTHAPPLYHFMGAIPEIKNPNTELPTTVTIKTYAFFLHTTFISSTFRSVHSTTMPIRGYTIWGTICSAKFVSLMWSNKPDKNKATNIMDTMLYGTNTLPIERNISLPIFNDVHGAIDEKEVFKLKLIRMSFH